MKQFYRPFLALAFGIISGCSSVGERLGPYQTQERNFNFDGRIEETERNYDTESDPFFERIYRLKRGDTKSPPPVMQITTREA